MAMLNNQRVYVCVSLRSLGEAWYQNQNSTLWASNEQYEPSRAPQRKIGKVQLQHKKIGRNYGSIFLRVGIHQGKPKLVNTLGKPDIVLTESKPQKLHCGRLGSRIQAQSSILDICQAQALTTYVKHLTREEKQQTSKDANPKDCVVSF